MPSARIEEKINVSEASLDKNDELWFFFLFSLNTNDINYRTRYLHLCGGGKTLLEMVLNTEVAKEKLYILPLQVLAIGLDNSL